MKKNCIVGLCIMVLLITSCNKTSKEITQIPVEHEKNTGAVKPNASPVKKASAENFDSFYQHFHSDSLFQMKRLKFPMQGYTMDTSGNQVPWTKQNWLMHRMGIQQIDTSLYTVEVKKESGVYEEDIYIEGGGFRTKRLFKLEQGKWYLIRFEDEEL